MERKDLLIRLALLIFLIFLLNLAAMKFYWYFSIWWLDMFMHFLGGFWLGLAVLWASVYSAPSQTISIQLIFKVILGVLFIGIFWEVFEIFVNNISLKDSFDYFDTLSDICFDLAGGLFAAFYFFRKSPIHV